MVSLRLPRVPKGSSILVLVNILRTCGTEWSPCIFSTFWSRTDLRRGALTSPQEGKGKFKSRSHSCSQTPWVVTRKVFWTEGENSNPFVSSKKGLGVDTHHLSSLPDPLTRFPFSIFQNGESILVVKENDWQLCFQHTHKGLPVHTPCTFSRLTSIRTRNGQPS